LYPCAIPHWIIAGGLVGFFPSSDTGIRTAFVYVDELCIDNGSRKIVVVSSMYHGDDR